MMVPSMQPEQAGRSAFIVGIIIAMLGATLFAGKAIVAKLMYRYGVDALTLMTWRMLMSAPLFLVIGMWQSGKLPSLQSRDKLRILFLGVIGYYLSSLLDFMGLEYISVGLERLIMFLTPSFVMLLSIVLYRRRTNLYAWMALLVSYMGTILVLVYDLHATGSQVWWGTFLVVLAAISYAFYLLLSGEMVARVGALRLSAYAMCTSTVVCLMHFLVTEPVAHLVQPMPVYQLSLINAIFCTVFPALMTMVAVQRIGAAATSQAGMVGPVATLFFGATLLDEPITLVQVLGTGLVLSGIYMLTKRRS